MASSSRENGNFGSPTTMGILSRASPGALSPGGSPRSPAVEKLLKIKETVSSLHGDLREEIEFKRETESIKIGELREMCVKNDKNLALEIKRRSEADKVLQSLFENSLNDMRDTMEKKMNERFAHMQLTIEVLTKRTAQLEKELQEEREAKNRAVEETFNLLMSQINTLQGAFDVEQKNRLEKEAAITKKLSDDVARLTERLDGERLSREGSLTQLREDLDKNQRVRDKNDEKFQTCCVEEIESLKTGLRLEAEARENSEEEIVRTMKEVINELKEGLHIVSK